MVLISANKSAIGGKHTVKKTALFLLYYVLTVRPHCRLSDEMKAGAWNVEDAQGEMIKAFKEKYNMK